MYSNFRIYISENVSALIWEAILKQVFFTQVAKSPSQWQMNETNVEATGECITVNVF